MTYFYASSQTALDAKAESRLIAANDVARVGKLASLCDNRTHTVKFYKLPMGPIERLWAYVSLIFLAPLSLLFPQFRDKTSECQQGAWLIYSITPLKPKSTGSSIASVAARATSLASPVAGGTGLALSPAASAAAAPPPPPVVAAGGAVESALPSAIVASGGGSGRAVTYEMSAPPRAPDRASQILAGECSILDRVVQRDLALQLRTLSDDQLRRVIDKVKEQINLAKAELIGLMAIRDESDFIKHAPRMRELFTGLFDCLYIFPEALGSKSSVKINAYYLAGPYGGKFAKEFPFVDAAINSPLGDAYIDFAFDAFVSIAEKLCLLPLERQLLIDCEYPLHLLESLYLPKDDRKPGRPVVRADPSSNIVILFRDYLQLSSPYLAGHLNVLHSTGVLGEENHMRYRYLADRVSADAGAGDVLASTMLGIATEVHQAVQFLYTTGSEMLRIGEWPPSVRPCIRALFDLTDTANCVRSPSMHEIAHGPSWRLIRVPQETDNADEPIHRMAASDCPISLHTITGTREAAQLSILAEIPAIGCALLTPLTSGTTVKKSVEEVESFLDNLETLKGATSIQNYSERLLSDDGVFISLCREQGLTPAQIAVIIEDRRRSFLGAQKARDFLVQALAEGIPLEKLLAQRRFIYYLYRYLWFLNNVADLPDLSLLEAASEPGASSAHLTQIRALITRNPLDRKISIGGFMRDLLQPLTRVGGKTIVRTSSLTDVSRLMSPSTIVIYQEDLDPHVIRNDHLISVAMPA